MTEMLIGMCRILLTWVFMWGVFSGWGLLIAGLAGYRVRDVRRILDCFWIGFCGVIAFLQVSHCFAPVNVWAFWSVTAVGLIGLCCCFRRPAKLLLAVPAADA